MTTLDPKLIDRHPDVRASFQTDLNFKPLYVSSSEAESALEIAETCIEAASRASAKVGLGCIDRICASSPTKQLMIFGLHASQKSETSAHIFGLTTEPDVKLESLVQFVTSHR